MDASYLWKLFSQAPSAIHQMNGSEAWDSPDVIESIQPHSSDYSHREGRLVKEEDQSWGIGARIQLINTVRHLESKR